MPERHPSGPLIVAGSGSDGVQQPRLQIGGTSPDTAVPRARPTREPESNCRWACQDSQHGLGECSEREAGLPISPSTVGLSTLQRRAVGKVQVQAGIHRGAGGRVQSSGGLGRSTGRAYGQRETAGGEGGKGRLVKGQFLGAQ